LDFTPSSFALIQFRFPRISFRKRDGFSFRVKTSIRLRRHWRNLQKAHPRPRCVSATPGRKTSTRSSKGVIAQIAKHRARGVVRILAKASRDFRVNVTCSRTQVRVPSFMEVHHSSAPTGIGWSPWNSRECRAESLPAAPKAAWSESPLQIVCIGSALFLPWSPVRVAAPIAEAAPGSLSSGLFSGAPESGGTPRFDP